MTVLIIGASIAGVRTAQALRRRGFEGPITVVGEEEHQPYDRPPLSKEVLATPGPAGPPALLAAGEAGALGLDLRLGVRAVAVDRSQRTVTTADGERLPFSHLVIATGVKPRTLPGAADLDGVYTLRTAGDALALRSELSQVTRVVVIGAGFIGAEFAAAARARGVQVCVVEAQDTPMAHLLGARVGGMLAGLHQANGVPVHAGARFAHFTADGEGRVTGVALADGRTLPADLVVIGIGTRPATEWLVSSGLSVPDGVDCDASLRVPGLPGAFAAGDVARRHHPHYGIPLRIEHWTNAGEHAEIVAAEIVGDRAPRTQVPYVWSDQYGRRIQIVGRPTAGKLRALRGGIDQDSLVAVYADPAGAVVGAVAVDDPRALMTCRKAIMAGTAADGLGPEFALTA